MIILTKSATTQAKKLLNQKKSALGLRIAVKPSGCNGFRYVLEYVEHPQSNDLVENYQGIDIYIDPTSQPILENLTLDWQKEGVNQGFKFINPLEQSRCGCGQSFGIHSGGSVES